MRRLLASQAYQAGNLKKRVNAKDDEGLSALHYAARYNHVPIVQLLVEHLAGKHTLIYSSTFWVLALNIFLFTDI